MKINISLAIRATDDTNKVKAMLEFLKGEGFTLTPAETPNETPNMVQRPLPNTPPSVLAKYGPNEAEWRRLNPNTHAPMYKKVMQARFPNGKEDMFAAALDGSLTQAAIATSNNEPNEYVGCPNEGAVLTGPIVILTPNEDDYN